MKFMYIKRENNKGGLSYKASLSMGFVEMLNQKSGALTLHF